MPVDFYNINACKLAGIYQSKTFAEVHYAWLEYLPAILNTSDARILDIGAGAGRDSKYLAEQGKDKNISVTAIEPAQTLAELGKIQTRGLNVQWLHDSLPDLKTLDCQQNCFDLILLSAVWMHIPVIEREHCIRKLAGLLKPGGKLVISLRHGPSGDQRIMHKVCADELICLAKSAALSPILVTDQQNDLIGRAEVNWQTVVFIKENEK